MYNRSIPLSACRRSGGSVGSVAEYCVREFLFKGFGSLSSAALPLCTEKVCDLASCRGAGSFLFSVKLMPPVVASRGQRASVINSVPHVS